MSDEIKDYAQEFKGVKITYELKDHDKKNHKMYAKFSLNDADYDNAVIIPKAMNDEARANEYAKLIRWAHTIINENLTQK